MQDTFRESGGLCGWFSEESAERWGSMIYSTPNGGTVEVTAVGQCGGRPPRGEFRGRVVVFLRQGREGTSSQQLVLPDQLFSGQRDNDYVPQSVVGSAGPPAPPLDLVPGAQGLRLAEAERRLEEAERLVANTQQEVLLLLAEIDSPARADAFQLNNPISSTTLRRGLTPFPLDTALPKAQSDELADAQRKIAAAQREIDKVTAQLNAVTQVMQPSKRFNPLRGAREKGYWFNKRAPPSRDLPTYGIFGPTSFAMNPNREVYTAQPSAGTAASDVLDRRNAALNQYFADRGADEFADAFSTNAQAANYIEWLQDPEDMSPPFMTPSGWTSPFSRPAEW
ncbi:hypothetical protein pqer_cds_690 [Pandoravirus quercus]|uniref:Uncharacterized protein n=1 Tax=Pandoravirus quercus TaxID=2107709 RepID=A0A2U7U9P0_9VIRU|nr:hypothetical protein pqer_cds_690 [Pandoravirus quercus]AVK75112.1 hypothetical protein pqer_cds_690 [Pandoravirus quercus]